MGLFDNICMQMLKKSLLLTNSNKVSLDIYLPQEKLISLTHPQFLIQIEAEDALAKLIFLMANKCLS